MKNCLIFLCVGISIGLYPLSPVVAQDVLEMQRVIELQLEQLEEQQKQIDAQQQQLQEQRNMLVEMQQKIQGLTGAVEVQEPAGDRGVAAKTSEIIHVRRTDTQTTRRDKTHPDESWEGSFGLKGLDTRIKIGGFAELDVIHDTDAIASKGQFITSTIATGDGASKVDGAHGQTNFSVNPSRLYVETRTPVGQRRLTTFLSMDFYDDALGVSPDPRMRQAYGELTDILLGGDLLAGQAWSTFADLEAYPNTLDFQGPNSFFGTRQPLLRWSRGLTDGLKLMLAMETPDNHIIEGADSLTAWPDGVVSLVWDKSPLHLMGSFVARDLRASFNDGPTESAFGWGGSVSGKLGVPFIGEKDFVTFSLTYGEGVGSDFNDQPSDAVFDHAGYQLTPIPVFGYFLSYEHWWSQQINSTLVYGALEAHNRHVQASDSFKETQYASANLIWTPTERWLFGFESLWGKRLDKDGSKGTDFRTQITTKFIF